jgi:phasin family protein
MNEFFNNDYFKAFQDMAKNFQSFPAFSAMQNSKTSQFPQVDVNKLLTLQRKNVEAMAEVGKAFGEGAQAIARLSTEFFRDSVEEALGASRDLIASASAPEKAAAKQGEFAKSVVKSSVEQLREVSEVAAKTSFEAFDILSNRFNSSIDEAKNIASTTASKKAA